MKTILPLLLALQFFASCQNRDLNESTNRTTTEGVRDLKEITVQMLVNQPEEIKVKEKRSGTWSPNLSEEEKVVLLAIANDSLDWCVGGSKSPFSFEAYQLTQKLKLNTATFVTLQVGDNLRGCIGSLSPEEPMAFSVHNNAVNAAMRDPRFHPVQPSELASIDIAVSLLSPIRPIPSASDFRLGEHGIILQKGARRAVFLPEVAIEQGWTREQTLSQLSMKAGLPPDAWKGGASFQVFESVVLTKEKR